MNNRLNQLLRLSVTSPDDPFILYAIGLEYASTGEFKKAVTALESLLGSHPDYLPVYYQLASWYTEERRTEEARRVFKKGIEVAGSQNEEKIKNELRQALLNLEFEENG